MPGSPGMPPDHQDRAATRPAETRPMPVRRVQAGIAAALLLAGCGHSAPFTAADGTTDSPFAALVPTRLTFDAGADILPQWTTDGRVLLYSFERHLPGAEYPDRCLGALPPTGGQRIGEWCWPGHEEATRRDGIEVGALSEDGRLFFVHHYGAGEKQPNPHKGSAYVADSGEIGAATRLFDVLVPQPGASARWDYFLAPVFTAPGAVTGLASAARIDQPCPTCGWDTVYIGLDLVRVDVGSPGTMTVLARIGRASFLSWDRSNDRFFFARDGRIETVPTGGGEPALVWQVPRSADRSDNRITGLAAAAGRLVVSQRWTEHGEVRNQLGVLGPDGTIEELAASINFPRWERLALSPDGQRLVVERRDASGERDLYLYELP